MNEQEPQPPPLYSPHRTICHWGLFKRSCQQVVQLSAHPHWSGEPSWQREKKSTGRELGREKEKCCGSFYLSVALTASQGMPWEGDQCRTSGFPQFIVRSEPNHLPKTGGELKASLYDNHPWYYSHYDDSDLQMSPCASVCTFACA